jgi:hypothetical protein
LASLLMSSRGCNLWVIATPMAGLRDALTAMSEVSAPVACARVWSRAPGGCPTRCRPKWPRT